MSSIEHILQKKCENHIQLAKQVDAAKSNFQVLRTQLSQCKETVKTKSYKNSQLDKKLCNLNEYTEKEKENIKRLEYECEKLYTNLDQISLEQSHYQLMQMREDISHQSYTEILQKMRERDLSVKREQKKTEMNEKKKQLDESRSKLKEILEAKKTKLQEKSDQIAKTEQENLVLKKRNAAILIRQRHQIQEVEARNKEKEQRLRMLQEHFNLKSAIELKKKD